MPAIRRTALVLAVVLALAGGARAGQPAGTRQRPGTSAATRAHLLRPPFDARVIRIADGDTLEAVPAGEEQPIRIRLHAVDAPELGEAFSRDAQTLIRRLLLDRVVQVTGRDIDTYGRLVARVAASGLDASTELVRAGLACYAYATDAALAKEEARARAAGAGFWAATATKPQCVARSASRTGSTTARATPAATQFRGNVTSGVYHASTCPNYTCRNCTREFTSEAEAKAAGFRPAGDCAKR